MAGVVQGKIAVVTGSGSGIGRAAVLALAKEGAKVAVSDIVVIGGEETVHRLGKPEEIAAAVVRLCSDAASFVTGLPMAVEGGLIAQ